jgi:hypothetical protein
MRAFFTFKDADAIVQRLLAVRKTPFEWRHVKTLKVLHILALMVCTAAVAALTHRGRREAAPLYADDALLGGSLKNLLATRIRSCRGNEKFSSLETILKRRFFLQLD